jgi:hypothetical protein
MTLGSSGNYSNGVIAGIFLLAVRAGTPGQAIRSAIMPASTKIAAVEPWLSMGGRQIRWWNITSVKRKMGYLQ